MAGRRKRQNNVFVDHIVPVVDAVVGWTSYDDFIERLFCNSDNLQVLCKECHDAKSADEKEKRKNGNKKVDSTGSS